MIVPETRRPELHSPPNCLYLKFLVRWESLEIRNIWEGTNKAGYSFFLRLKHPINQRTDVPMIYIITDSGSRRIGRCSPPPEHPLLVNFK